MAARNCEAERRMFHKSRKLRLLGNALSKAVRSSGVWQQRLSAGQKTAKPRELLPGVFDHERVGGHANHQARLFESRQGSFAAPV